MMGPLREVLERGVRSIRVVGILMALATLLLTSVTTASAATSVERYVFKGSTVYAESSTATACTEQYTTLSGFVTKSRVTVDQPTVVYTSFLSNYCENTFTYTVGSASATTFEVSGQQGRLVASVPVTVTTYDTVTNEVWTSTSSMSLDLTFTASGSVFTQSYSQTYSERGVYRYSFNSRGTFRNATVSGTPDLAWTFAYIGRTTSGELTVTH